MLSLPENCTVDVGNIILTKAGDNLFQAIEQIIDPLILSSILESWTNLSYNPELIDD
jgi:hypothetical protein